MYEKSSTSQQSPANSEQGNFPMKSDNTPELKTNESNPSPDGKRSAGSQLAEILQMTGDIDSTIMTTPPTEPGCQYNNNMTVAQRMEQYSELDHMRLDQTQLDTNRNYLLDFPIYVRGRSRLQVLPEEQENSISDEENMAVEQEQINVSPVTFAPPSTTSASKDLSDMCSSRLNRTAGN
ncbi:hypothetical protein FBUS_05188 [Fasciolopsis buskii]|uniref:Uncharacterized protein n=1 Tax=Fasciolopsis buskii TaxID=27845 RepID=A0A8E0S380_9TREM|nr:hypothetical protein FBUS_05188 [Fasciolopsis buski]